jgi:RNA polymerase sigma factor CnrH
MTPADLDPDLPLVQAAQGGSRSAFDELIQRHQLRLHHFILRYVGQPEDAVDLTQETFIRAYFHLAQFKPEARFSTWLFRIALNLCLDHTRSRRHRQGQMTDSMNSARGELIAELSAPTPDPSQQLIQEETRRAVRRAVAQLPPELKAPLILTALEGLSQHEAARHLRVSIKAIEGKVARARKWLHKRLNKNSKG